MWAINNTSPFAAERAWVRNSDGAEVWLVVIRGSFTIADDGSLSLADVQRPPQLAPAFVGDNHSLPLLFDTDFPIEKKGTDILVYGNAHVPGTKPKKQIDVGLEVHGHFNKTLRVSGNRQWEVQGLHVQASEATDFKFMPLDYSHAFGGFDRATLNLSHPDFDERNPSGCGFSSQRKHADTCALPNIEYPQHLVDDWKDRPPPAGFGPIAGHWLPRRAFAGTYSEQWQRERAPLLPEDFNPQFFQSAPSDQQCRSFLRGGETISLSNFTASGCLNFKLPRISMVIKTRFEKGSFSQRPRLHTVAIDAEEKRLELVWHSALQCHAHTYQLRESIIRYKPRFKITAKGRQHIDPFKAARNAK